MNRDQSNFRLPYDENAIFSGRLIHRGRPIKFQLEGMTISGYEGDTVLSALLGMGYNSVGTIRDEPLALTSNFCPHVVLNDKKSAPAVLPMARTPAQNGMNLSLYRSPDFVELDIAKPKLGFIHSLLGKTKRSLDFNFEVELTLPNPWLEQKSEGKKNYDLVIIGGGVAGMGAAQKASEHGLHVALVEKDFMLGGDARFFGASEGEPRADEFVSQLITKISNSKLIDVFLNAEAISLGKQHVRVHSILAQNGNITSKVDDFEAENFILATGMLEQLPIFAGNRLPGVIRAKEAFGLAAKFGIWPGKSSIISTNSSPATQVALFAADMGISIKKLTDSRAAPKSRFFEFAKAYGISLATGTQIHTVSPDKSDRLQVQFCLADDTDKLVGDPIVVDRLIVCGGWQPDLRLWYGAGGKTKWDTSTEKLGAVGGTANVFLAGSCIGVQGMTDCLVSGQNAVNTLLKNDKTANAIPSINPEHESIDGQLPVSISVSDEANCYLDCGHSLAQPAPTPQVSFWKRLFLSQQNVKPDFSQTRGENTLIDVVAKVKLGEIPAQFAGVFAQERCGIVAELQHSLSNNDVYSAYSYYEEGPVPAYLWGRFGQKEQMVRLRTSNDTSFEIGNFVFRDHEASTPKAAVGSIVKIDKNDKSLALALVEASICASQSVVIVRHGTGATTATIQTLDN